ncbi:MAG: TonB-dependent receptor [Mangrovibacterium sp.]
MFARFYLSFVILLLCSIAHAQAFFGVIRDAETKLPVEYAYIMTVNKSLWAMTDEDGKFKLNSIPNGKTELEICCLGYAKKTITLMDGKADAENNVFFLRKDNLSLSEVVITATKNEKDIDNSFTIDRNAINQTLAVDFSSLLSLMPGEQTSSFQTLNSVQRIAIRSGGAGELDNPDYGTAIEIDGVRLSNNSAFNTQSQDGVDGIDTRNIGISNIESVEIISGLPSVEYGDLNAGLVKINTKKGKSPLQVELTTKPMIKSFGISKGFDLPNSKGQLNLSAERTASIANRASPYDTYHRNNLGVTYRRQFNRASPIVLTSGVSGNFGGRNTESDPDAFTDTYSKYSDANLRAYASMDWAVNKKWLANLQLSTSLNYTNKTAEVKSNKSSASATASIHTTDEGYLLMSNYDDDTSAPIYAIPAGYWYETAINEEKPFSANVKLKASWNQQHQQLYNHFTLGAELNHNKNLGTGLRYADERYAPTYRPFDYSEQPAVNTWALFAEDKLSFPFLGKDLEIRAGMRLDINTINGSIYGNVSALSPRVNAMYKLIDNRNGTVKKLNLNASFGDAIKLPSSAVLFPSPTYRNIQTFASPTYSDGTVYYGYYTSVATPTYNQNLAWQRSRKGEIGLDMTIKKTKVSLTAYINRTFNPYKYETNYTPLSYKLTTQSALNDLDIPINDRYYSIDNESGIVTAHDQTGKLESQDLAYTTRNTYQGRTSYANGSPVGRRGLEWVVDFGKIESLKTSVRLDGKYYHYKGWDETIEADLASSGNMANGEPYKYVGYYVGGNAYSNGTESKRLANNFTLTTHIPEVRMIVSLRVEATFLNTSQRLSEYSQGTRSYVLDSNADYFPSETSTGSIYDGDVPMATYPLYYTSLDDPNAQIPFMETFRWAYENDKELYNELAKMVKKPTYTYWMNKQSYSPYYSANISVTKEIGDKMSVSFNAQNFTSRTATIKESQTDTEESLFNSMIPPFYYGLSLRVKL